MNVFLGYGRIRNERGEVVNRHFNPYTNALHAQVGHARDNMEVLVAEFDMDKIKTEGSISSSQNARVVSTEGISPAVTNGEKDGMPKIIQNGHGFNKGGEHDISPTLTSSKFQDNNFVKEQPYRIRRLTPRETFRLRDVSDRDIDKIQQAGISNTQQYKMAGNSIVVSCLEKIFESLFINDDTTPTDHNGQYILF